MNTHFHRCHTPLKKSVKGNARLHSAQPWRGVRIKGGLQNDFKSLKGVLEHQKSSKWQWALIIVNISETWVLNSTPQNHRWVYLKLLKIFGVQNGRFYRKPKPCAVSDVCTSYQDVCCCFPQIFHAQGDWGQFLLKFPCPQLFFLGIRYISQGKKKINFSPMV